MPRTTIPAGATGLPTSRLNRRAILSRGILTLATSMTLAPSAVVAGGTSARETSMNAITQITAAGTATTHPSMREVIEAHRTAYSGYGNFLETEDEKADPEGFTRQSLVWSHRESRARINLVMNRPADSAEADEKVAYITTASDFIAGCRDDYGFIEAMIAKLSECVTGRPT